LEGEGSGISDILLFFKEQIELVIERCLNLKKVVLVDVGKSGSSSCENVVNISDSSGLG